MSLDLAFVNGKILAARDPAISPLDAGFQQGVGVYETLSVLRGRPVFLREHLRRMEGARLFVGLPVPRWGVEESVGTLLRRTGPVDAGLRITCTQGTAEGPTLAITLRPIPEPPSPLRLWISLQRKRLGDPWESVKTISRARNALAREEALAQGAYEALLPTDAGDLAEGSVSNLFFVRDGALLTPPLDRGCLPGVTRDKILEAARRLGISAVETPVFPADLDKAQEILVSNALLGVCAADELIGRWTRPQGAPGAVAAKLQGEYRRMVEEHLRLPEGSPELQ